MIRTLPLIIALMVNTPLFAQQKTVAEIKQLSSDIALSMDAESVIVDSDVEKEKALTFLIALESSDIRAQNKKDYGIVVSDEDGLKITYFYTSYTKPIFFASILVNCNHTPEETEKVVSVIYAYYEQLVAALKDQLPTRMGTVCYSGIVELHDMDWSVLSSFLDLNEKEVVQINNHFVLKQLSEVKENIRDILAKDEPNSEKISSIRKLLKRKKLYSGALRNFLNLYPNNDALSSDVDAFTVLNFEIFLNKDETPDLNEDEENDALRQLSYISLKESFPGLILATSKDNYSSISVSFID
ncbi:MAG: hypothetical protein V1647_02865, partial [Pseudomonadota bacterium]